MRLYSEMRIISYKLRKHCRIDQKSQYRKKAKISSLIGDMPKERKSLISMLCCKQEAEMIPTPVASPEQMRGESGPHFPQKEEVGEQHAQISPGDLERRHTNMMSHKSTDDLDFRIFPS